MAYSVARPNSQMAGAFRGSCPPAGCVTCLACASLAGLVAGGALRLVSRAQPFQSIENQPVLHFVGKRGGQLLTGSGSIVHVVMAHVEVDHAIFLICPDRGIVSVAWAIRDASDLA
jgi:hypothetical protein